MNAKRLAPLLARIPSLSRKLYTNHARNLQIIQKQSYSGLSAVSKEKSAIVESASDKLIPENATKAAPVQKVEEKEFNEELATLQLLKCGRTSHLKSLDLRRDNLQNIWTRILKNKHLVSINAYNTYIQVCIDNELPIDYKTFLQLAQVAKPNQQTYLLLLSLSSRLGDVNEAVEILTEMKAQGIAADENVFNALIVGYTLHKGLEGANYVLGTMKLAQIAITSNTNWAILGGLVRHGKRNEFRQFLEIIPKLNQGDKEYLDLLFEAGVRGQHEWLEDILGDFNWDAKDRAFLNGVHELCLDLVHRGQPDAAIYYHNTFVDPVPNTPYGKHLLKEMLMCKVPIEKVIDVSKKLMGKNPYSLFDLSAITLNKQLVEESYKTFECLTHLRPHFFWPIIQIEGRQKGEFGVYAVLKKMHEFNVKPDYTTFEDYVLKYCNLADAKSTMETISQIPNIMHRDVLSPLVAVLLREGRIDEAKIICLNSNKIPLLGDQLIKHVGGAWESTKNVGVVAILQKICETNSPSVDWTGIFLDRCLKNCKTAADCNKITTLIKTLDEHHLKITSTFYDRLMHSVLGNVELAKFKVDLEGHLERILDITKQDNLRITHPKDMNVEELEHHLIELKAKHMETRGVLRKLIMAHAKLGNHERVNELRLHMKAQNYEESAGLKSQLFHSLALSGNLIFAKGVLEELKLTYPSFKIDSFKIIDYATLLVREGDVEEALSILKREARSTKFDNSMDRNCWILLGAAKKPEDAFKLFQLLVDKNFCKPTNVILGPILRPLINTETVDKLVSNFCNCSEQYKATPLQLEVLCVVLEAKNEQLLQKVINAISAVHGPAAARIGLISALAEKGLEKPLLKLLADRSQLRISDLQARIQRWVNEDKLVPLQTLEAANKRLSINAFDNLITSSAIIKIHCNRMDCATALDYWRHLEENDGGIDKQCARELISLLLKQQFTVPDSLKNASR